MKTKTVTIKSSLGYVDGFDGVHYEWTKTRKEAWPMSLKEAQERIERIRQDNPDAEITRG